jgi:hypothetical protein
MLKFFCLAASALIISIFEFNVNCKAYFLLLNCEKIAVILAMLNAGYYLGNFYFAMMSYRQ